MEPLDAVTAARPFDPGSAPIAGPDSDLDALVDLAAATDVPVVIRDEEGGIVGAVTKDRLLRAIKEGK